jgi:hypothetical protein
MILKYNGTDFECEYASKANDTIKLYNSDYKCIQSFSFIYGSEWDAFTLEGGDWTDITDIPDYADKLKSDIDYLDMQAESLEASDEANRADIDYCLMMLDDGATDEQLDDTTTEETGTTVTDEPTTDSTTDDGDTTDEQLG